MTLRSAEAIVSDTLVFVSVSCGAVDDEAECEARFILALGLLIEQAGVRMKAAKTRRALRHNSELWNELA